MSHLEETFAVAWRVWGKGPRPVREYRFHPTRRWLMDFAWPRQRVAVEIEGGTYSNGRHTRGSGFADDCTKYNAAALLGWTVLRFPGTALNDPQTVVKTVRTALGLRKHPGLRAELRTRQRTALARALSKRPEPPKTKRGKRRKTKRKPQHALRRIKNAKGRIQDA